MSDISEIEIAFDQPRRLFFNFKAIRALDRVMGDVGLVPTTELLRALNFTVLERVLWAGLLHAEPTLTVALVGKRLERFIEAGGNAGDLFIKAHEAINVSKVFGGVDGDEPAAHAPPIQEAVPRNEDDIPH